MEREEKTLSRSADTIDDPVVVRALNELGRSLNLITTYGKKHPASKTAVTVAVQAFEELFVNRKKISIGTFHGTLTVDGKPCMAKGSLLKSLENRLIRLHITGLKIGSGISPEEVIQLTELLKANDTESFKRQLRESPLNHVESENTQYKAVHDGQTVANESDLAGMGGNGVLVLEDDDEADTEGTGGKDEPSLHVEQIVAFLKGDVTDDEDSIGEELAQAASDPDKLGRLIMESVAIRQSSSELAGESLNDIILGCLRRTYDGLRKQPAFQSQEGKVELKNALLMLEESILEKMRALTGEDNPELDRQIVQAIREMDENLNFELAATQYMEHRDALQQNKEALQRYIQDQGVSAAEDLLQDSEFPGTDWRKIVVESRKSASPGGSSQLAEGLSTLTTVFEKLEQLMRSDAPDGSTVKDLLGQANDNLEDRLGTTREKLAALSSTIGGQAWSMSRSELLASLAEVAQELMQPLTAINASLEMMMQGYVGKISEEQKDLLTLASQSGEHLKFLMDMLIDIVGCPTNKGIDTRFHTTSELVQLMKDAEGQEHLPLHFQ